MSKVVFALGDDISTDDIYPGRFMATVLPSETPQYCFADHTEFNGTLKAGQIPVGSVVLGGDNFGCGSSREQAASTLQGHGLVIVARNFARIFMQNAINLGLRVVVAPEVEGKEADELDIGLDKVVNRTSGKSYRVVPLPRARQAIIDAGGLIPFTRKRVLEKAGK
jgi:3-isopropylmalate/(R)-2-methylmalate dehydratase small subunit